jgi:aldehyde dehydrogenase (NAD(P)+)
MTASATSASGLDDAIAQLRAGEERWGTFGLADRRNLLAELGRAVDAHAEEWVTVATRIKDLDPGSPLVGEEWISGPYALLTGIGALAASLAALDEGRRPLWSAW